MSFVKVISYILIGAVLIFLAIFMVGYFTSGDKFGEYFKNFPKSLQSQTNTSQDSNSTTSTTLMINGTTTTILESQSNSTTTTSTTTTLYEWYLSGGIAHYTVNAQAITCATDENCPEGTSCNDSGLCSI